jgi:ABC-type transporter Mla subunit MlaD
VAEITKDTVNTISKQMHTLSENSDEALSNLRKTSDSLSIKSKEIDSMMQSVIKQSKTHVDNMRDQVQAVAEKGDEAALSIGQSMSTLMSTMDSVNTKTKSVVSYISETNQSLYDQSGRFVTAVAKSAEAAEHASEIFANQSDNLLKASRAAVERAQQIEKTELRAGRDNFLNSARFVLESLHSLSIDFVRTLDGEIQDKDWKSYQKGDVALFTTKLAKRLEELPADKIRTKYAEDVEFRTYVQKFMRQFEDILEQTNTVDRGAVLGTTFAASDVGKIYSFLQNTIGKEKKAA